MRLPASASELGCGLGVADRRALAGAEVMATDYDDALEFAAPTSPKRRLIAAMVNWVEMLRDLPVRRRARVGRPVRASIRRPSRTRSRQLSSGRRSHRTDPGRIALQEFSTSVTRRPGTRERPETVRRWRDLTDGDVVETRWRTE